jgi:hypothetical protein
MSRSAPRLTTSIGLYLLALCLASAPRASAAIADIVVDPANTIPGTVANLLQADGHGVDWMWDELRVELTGGSVYNTPAFDSAITQPTAFWSLVPELQWDTAVGIPDDGTSGIPGGCAALDCTVVLGLLASDNSPQLIAAGVFNTNLTDFSLVQTGTVTLSDDAAGTWQRATSFGDGTLILTSGPVINGVMVPEPGTLAMFASGAFAALRRRRGSSRERRR